MIAADVSSRDDHKAQHTARFFNDTNGIEGKDLFVTYDIFARTYWPRFPQLLTKGLGMYFSYTYGVT